MMPATRAARSLKMENTEQVQTPNPQAAPPPSEHPVMLTAKAVEMVKITRDQEGIDPSHGLRVAVRGGGRRGFEDPPRLEGEERPNDLGYHQHRPKGFLHAVRPPQSRGPTAGYP